MIVSRIDGGLGNQMFQYAYGLYLARKHKTELVLDLGSYASRPQHGYSLDHFNIQARVADQGVHRRLPLRYRPDSVPRRFLPDCLNPAVLSRVKEVPFGFRPHYLEAHDKSYLVGYWQSEKFFPGMRDTLVEHFTPRNKLSKASLRVIDRMHQFPSIALHIRRGDYLNSPYAAQLYEQVSRDYYQACINQWMGRMLNVRVFVFSNDLDWCRENLQLPARTQFVNHSTSQNAFEDMIMMSHADCCVTANSTFSWWAAYLNERADKTVFVPRQWFRPGTLDASNIACSDWLAVDADPHKTLQRVA
jgi:hypothetical protein